MFGKGAGGKGLAVGGVSKLAHGGAQVGFAKKRRAGHQCVSAGIYALGDRFGVDAAIHLDSEAKVFPLSPLCGGLNFGENFREECLPAESGMHGHDEEQVDGFEVGKDGFYGGWRIDGESGFEAGVSDLPKQRLDSWFQFRVNGNGVGAGFFERLDQDFRAFAHEVNVQKQRSQAAKCFDDARSKAEVRHKVAVHDVEVKPICAGAINAPKFSIEAGKIGGEK